jgi:hypothetical protein
MQLLQKLQQFKAKVREDDSIDNEFDSRLRKVM